MLYRNRTVQLTLHAAFVENRPTCSHNTADSHVPTLPSSAPQAIRLREAFIESFKAGKTAARELREAGLSWRDVFQEVWSRLLFFVFLGFTRLHLGTSSQAACGAMVVSLK